MDREKFEDAAYRAYFIRSIVIRGGQHALKDNVLDKATLCERDGKNDYVREDISAMWFGWNLYQKEIQND